MIYNMKLSDSPLIFKIIFKGVKEKIINFFLIFKINNNNNQLIIFIKFFEFTSRINALNFIKIVLIFFQFYI